MNIEIKNNTFEIIRNEGWGYVHHKCEYDKSILKLEILLEPSGLEGGNCKTIYKFKILKRTNSYITFIQNDGDKKSYEYFLYNSKLNSIVKLSDNRFIKCVIL